MDSFWLPAHSFFRWIVSFSLLYAVYRAYRGYTAGRSFTRTDNLVRHWTATFVHIQMTLGFILYFTSPLIRFFFSHTGEATEHPEALFFGLVHIVLMLTAVVIITIGSALAKRETEARRKFRYMLVWFGLGLIIILAAVPWPFSPLAARPWIR